MLHFLYVILFHLKPQSRTKHVFSKSQYAISFQASEINLKKTKVRGWRQITTVIRAKLAKGIETETAILDRYILC